MQGVLQVERLYNVWCTLYTVQASAVGIRIPRVGSLAEKVVIGARGQQNSISSAAIQLSETLTRAASWPVCLAQSTLA